MRIDKSLGLAVVGKIAPTHGPVEGCAKHPIIYRVSAILLVDLRGLSNHISSGCQWMVGVLPGMLPGRLVKLTLIDYCQLCIIDDQFLILVVLFFLMSPLLFVEHQKHRESRLLVIPNSTEILPEVLDSFGQHSCSCCSNIQSRDYS